MEWLRLYGLFHAIIPECKGDTIGTVVMKNGRIKEAPDPRSSSDTRWRTGMAIYPVTICVSR